LDGTVQQTHDRHFINYQAPFGGTGNSGMDSDDGEERFG
jgi:hypothetical protein